jgi:hypothetical protein
MGELDIEVGGRDAGDDGRFGPPAIHFARPHGPRSERPDFSWGFATVAVGSWVPTDVNDGQRS